MKAFIKLMKALSDPNRVRIVKLLEHRELCACEIQELIGLAQSTVSRHMKMLEDTGLVDSTREGTWLIYRRTHGDLPYTQNLSQNIGAWLNEDEAFQRMAARLSEVSRETLCSR